jgi:CRP-like cAMP-binding protein
MALLSGAARNATLRATKAADILAVSRGDLIKLLSGFPEFKSGLADLASRRGAPGATI